MQDPELPIKYLTQDILEKQGWDYHEEVDEDTEEVFNFWTLNLPKDNPDPNPPYLVTNRSDDELEGLEPGEYVAEIANFYGLGLVETEEDVEDLYEVLTGVSLKEHMD